MGECDEAGGQQAASSGQQLFDAALAAAAVALAATYALGTHGAWHAEHSHAQLNRSIEALGSGSGGGAQQAIVGGREVRRAGCGVVGWCRVWSLRWSVLTSAADSGGGLSLLSARCGEEGRCTTRRESEHDEKRRWPAREPSPKTKQRNMRGKDLWLWKRRHPTLPRRVKAL